MIIRDDVWKLIDEYVSKRNEGKVSNSHNKAYRDLLVAINTNYSRTIWEYMSPKEEMPEDIVYAHQRLKSLLEIKVIKG